MNSIKETISHDTAYLIPLGDMHIDDKHFNEKSEQILKEQIEWIRKRPNARAFITGDVFNIATRNSKTSPFSTNKRVINDFNGDVMAYAVHLFEPIRDKIIGAVDGNHEYRTRDYANRSWMTELCAKLSTKEREVKYCKDSCVLFLKVGKTNKGKNRSAQTYSGYIQHTTGGGSTPGSKINRVAKLEDIVVGCDFYIGAHNHMQGAVKLKTFISNPQNCTTTEIIQTYIDGGGFLDYAGYIERAQLRPTTIGAPTIEFESKHKLVKANI